MLSKYLWVICCYDRWGNSKDPASNGVDMFVKNVETGKENFPLANVHLPWSSIRNAWSAIPEDQKSQDIKNVKDALESHRDDLYSLFELGDSEGFYAILGPQKTDPGELDKEDPPEVPDKPAPKRRSRAKKGKGERE